MTTPSCKHDGEPRSGAPSAFLLRRVGPRDGAAIGAVSRTGGYKMSRKEGKGPRIDIYARITDRIVAELAKGVRPWMQPWHSANAIGRVTRPLRHNGLPYSGMNVLLLWSEAIVSLGS